MALPWAFIAPSLFGVWRWLNIGLRISAVSYLWFIVVWRGIVVPE